MRDAVPVAGREFSRTERVLVRVPAYGPGGTDAGAARAPAQPRRRGDERAEGGAGAARAASSRSICRWRRCRRASTSSRSRPATRTARPPSWSASASPADDHASPRRGLLVVAAIGPCAPQPAIAAASAGRLVTIDVIATDARGRVVTDLKPADFELREGSAVLPIESVRLVRVPAAPPAEPPAGIQSAADERLAAGQDAGAAVRDLSRRIPRRRRRGNRARARRADPLRRRDVSPARSRGRHEAARLAVRDPADARPRRGAPGDRELRGAPGRLHSRATPTSATTSPARRRASSWRATRWRCRRSTRSRCTSAA